MNAYYEATGVVIEGVILAIDREQPLHLGNYDRYVGRRSLIRLGVDKNPTLKTVEE